MVELTKSASQNLQLVVHLIKLGPPEMAVQSAKHPAMRKDPRAPNATNPEGLGGGDATGQAHDLKEPSTSTPSNLKPRGHLQLCLLLHEAVSQTALFDQRKH